MRRDLLKAGLLASLFIVGFTAHFGCGSGGGGGGGGKAVTRKVVPADNVVVMDDRPTLQLSDTTDGVFTFQRVAPLGAGVVPFEVLPGDTQGISPDQIIVGSEGSGYLRKVTSVSDTGTTLQVGTTATTMEDAFEELDTEYSDTLTPDEVQSARVLSEGVRLEGFRRLPDGSHIPGDIDPALFNEFRLDITDVVLYSSGGQSVKVNGSIVFRPDFKFSAKIKSFKLKRLETYIKLNPEASLGVSATMDLVSFKKEKELAVYNMKPITIWAGLVPVVLKPSLSVVIGVEGNLTTGLSASVTAGVVMKAGLLYENGAWRPIKEFSPYFTAQMPAVSTTCTVKAYAGPQLLVRIYGVAGPYITTAGYLEFEATMPGDPLWQLYAGFLVKAGAKIKIMGRVLVDYGVEIYSYKRLVGESTAASGNTVVTNPDQSLPEPGASPPTWPMMVNVVPVSPYQIDLSWDACFDDTRVVKYRILYDNDKEVGFATVTNYSDKGLTPSTNYCYKVLAVDTNGNESSGHYTWCAATPPPDSTPPSSPAGLAIIADSPASLWLSWAPATDNVFVTGYKVYQGTKPAGAVSSNNISVNGLYPTTNYCFTVTALDAEGNESGPSPEVCQTTLTDIDASSPSAPTGLTPAVVNSSMINLTWNPSTDNVRVAGYLIYAGATQIGSSFTTSFSAGHLMPGTPYSFTVKAYDPAGNLSGASTQANASTPATTPDGTPPTVPANPIATPASYDQINLSWTASTDNVGVTGYEVYHGENLAGSPAGASFSHTGLFPSTQYCYKVKAVDAAANQSAASVEACATTQAAP